jgi:hypothetical protein
VPVANRLCTMPALPRHRSKLRVPTEISLLGKGRDPAADGACSHCHRTPLVGEHVHLYGERIVCQLCRHLRREPPGETVVVHSSEHHRTVKGAERLRFRAA